VPCLRYQSHQTDHSISPAQSSAWPYRATHWGGLSNVSGSACTGGHYDDEVFTRTGEDPIPR